MENDGSRISDEKLVELTALGDAATPRPWRKHFCTVLEKGCLCGSCRETVGYTFEHMLEHPEDDMREMFNWADAHFIENARNYWGPLIYEVQSLRRKVAEQACTILSLETQLVGGYERE